MSNSNPSLWGADWEKWFKSPWLPRQGGEGPFPDQAAAFAGFASMWFGGHPVIALPADSTTSLMKNAGMAFSDLMSQAAAHQAVLLQGWQGAFAAFAKDVSVWAPTTSGAVETDTIDSLDGLVARWTQTAEPILQQHAKSEGYIASQSRLMGAAMKWQKAQTALSDAFCNQMGIPTRTEVDEAFRMIHELRRARRREQFGRGETATKAPRMKKRDERVSVRRGKN